MWAEAVARNVGGARPETITKVAIVAGGGDDPALFEEAERWAAQAFITGEWTTRAQPADKQSQAWAAANRAACQAYAEKTGMALLAFSHAATEFLVMKGQMARYFGRWACRQQAWSNLTGGDKQATIQPRANREREDTPCFQIRSVARCVRPRFRRPGLRFTVGRAPGIFRS